MKKPEPSSSEVSSLGSRCRRLWRKIWPRDAPPGGGPKPFSKLEGTPPPPQRSSSSFLENFSAVRSEEKSGKANPSSRSAEGRHLADGYLQKAAPGLSPQQPNECQFRNCKTVLVPTPPTDIVSFGHHLGQTKLNNAC